MKADMFLVLGYAGKTSSESRTPAAARVVDGSAYGHRSLVGGIAVATPTRLFRHALGETLELVF